MLPNSFDEITPDDILSLLANKVAERKVLEYKGKLPGGSDSSRKEFLADVCSFANTSGGDIIYGIRDERDATGKATGMPEAIVGLAGMNLPSEITRLESMIRDGIRPRIANLQTKDIEIAGHGSVVVLRIQRSWVGPHMVTYGGTSRFYARHSTGKYQLDVQEIGQAFAAQRSLGEQLRNWRAERAVRAVSDDGILALDGPAKLLLHFVPSGALIGERPAISWPLPARARSLLRPCSLATETFRRYNADGFLVYSVNDSGRCASYVQLFRNGSLEYGDGEILNWGKNYGKEETSQIPSRTFEEKLIEVFGNALLLINQLGITDTVYFSCTLLGVQGLRLSRTKFNDLVKHTFDRQIVQTPEVQIDLSESEPYRSSLLPVVNSIWQANGYSMTPFASDWT
jgi:hypothetical protein